MEPLFIDGAFSAGQRKPGTELSFSLIKENYDNCDTKSFGQVISNTTNYISESSWLEQVSTYITANYLSKKILTIGGDHTLALATISGVLKADPTCCILYIDAHADINSYESSLTKNLHGMPVNALINGGKSINESFSWIKPNTLRPSKIFYLGVRDIDPLEYVILEKLGIRYIKAEYIHDIVSIVNEVELTLDPYRNLNWHISLDLDSIDPSEFASTGCYSPNGMKYSDVKYILQYFNATNRCHSADIVEWNSLINPDSNCRDKVIDLINSCILNE